MPRFDKLDPDTAVALNHTFIARQLTSGHRLEARMLYAMSMHGATYDDPAVSTAIDTCESCAIDLQDVGANPPIAHPEYSCTRYCYVCGCCLSKISEEHDYAAF